MIAKRIPRKPDVRDDFSNLGRYVAAAREKGEKLDKFWISNCDAGTELDDLETALIEAEATRAMKPRIKDKTYHLVVSFRPGEQEKLSAEDMKDIERAYAEALGYADHQRIAGTHINTDHFHMHVAINKIHPTSHRCHTPKRDFFALAAVSRAMEQKYGLQIDAGIEGNRSPDGLSARSRDFEAKTWQQSFEGHLKEHRDEIRALVESATSWAKLHEGLADYDAELRKRGAGLVFHQIGGKRMTKASAIDRACALKALEDRLGPYEAPPERKPQERASPVPPAPKPPKNPYRVKPLTRHPATSQLWRIYSGARSATPKRPGFLARNVFSASAWRDYLMADAHKDAMSMAILVSYKEFLNLIEETVEDLLPRASKPYRAPASLKPVFNSWFKSSPWTQPAAPAGLDLEALGLKADEAGRVLFPLRDAAGHIWALRALDGQGRRCDIGDATARPDLAHIIDPDRCFAGPERYAGPIIVTADPLAALALHKEMGAPAVLVASEKDLKTRVRELRTQHPYSPITVAAAGVSRQATRAAEFAGEQLRAVDAEQTIQNWILAEAAKGKVVEVDIDRAMEMGAFVEDALSVEDALASAKRPAAEKTGWVKRDKATSQGKAPKQRSGIER